MWRVEMNVEVVLDQPGHVRLPITDDEIIDHAVAIEALAAREVRQLTCDTGQHTRGRATASEGDEGVREGSRPGARPGSGASVRQRHPREAT
ncbi:hypothetical protein GCM10022207_75220 [Streptomyces lannensis]|uniref:Uncharacterized protein n=1 Tax=Streptomyces lannensis TaxID=766498 RepID=A0ABP7L6N1_9ACTN